MGPALAGALPSGHIARQRRLSDTDSSPLARIDLETLRFSMRQVGHDQTRRRSQSMAGFYSSGPKNALHACNSQELNRVTPLIHRLLVL